MLVTFISLLLVIRYVEGLDHTMKQCPASTYSALEYYLKNHVISTQSSNDLADCVTKCWNVLRCKSFNFGRQQNSCELNNADRYTHPEDYVRIPGYIYSDNSVRHHKKGGFKSCAEIQEDCPSATSGYYWVKIRERDAQVYCDMERFGGGWTLVVSVSTTGVDHFQENATNCLNSILCVSFNESNLKDHKLDDKDIHEQAAKEGTFRMDVLTSGFTAFYQIPSGVNNFNSGCVLGSCPRIIMSHSYPYQWETNSCTSIDKGYHITNGCHRVFDDHDDSECGERWFSSQFATKRAIYGHYCPGGSQGTPGMTDYKEGLLFVK